jgi:2'-5' RNA ligase
MRAFVALPVSAAIREAAARVQEGLRAAGADVGWTRPEQMHLTVKFLGELGADVAARLAERLKETLPRRGPVALQYGGLGRFPAGGPPKVLWAGVKGEVAPLAELVEAAAEELGVPREARPYHPHLTLGRVRSARNAKALEGELARRKDVALGSDAPSELILYESTLGPGGAVHEARYFFRLTPSQDGQ